MQDFTSKPDGSITCNTCGYVYAKLERINSVNLSTLMLLDQLIKLINQNHKEVINLIKEKLGND